MVNNQKGIPIKDGDQFVFYSNPFLFLRQAAKGLIKDAKQAATQNDRQTEANHSLGAIALLLLSAEALINRVYEDFIKSKLPRKIYEEITDKWSFTMKWYFSPFLWGSGGPDKTFKIDEEPWQSFSELKKIRDYFAHPKPLQYPLKVLDAAKKTVDFPAGDIPRWPQTQIPRDLHHLRASDAQKALDTLTRMIDKLDSLMDGVIKKEDWYLTEKMTKAEGFVAKENEDRNEI